MILLILAIAACGPDEPPSARATVARPHSDTVTFVVPATAHRCSHGPSLLLQAADERGNGMLVLLRRGDSLATGTFPLIALGDSITRRGANVAVRYMKVDMAYGLSLDSGAVDLTATGDALAARVQGSGLDGGLRIGVDATYTGIPVPPSGDTVPCRFQP